MIEGLLVKQVQVVVILAKPKKSLKINICFMMLNLRSKQQKTQKSLEEESLSNVVCFQCNIAY